MAVSIPAIPNQINMKSMDALGENYTTNITKGFGEPLVSTYDYVDTAARALCALSTNTYVDSIVIMSKSVNEALAEG